MISGVKCMLSNNKTAMTAEIVSFELLMKFQSEPAGVISKRSEFSLITAHLSSYLEAVVTPLMAIRSLPDLYLLTYAPPSE